MFVVMEATDLARKTAEKGNGDVGEREIPENSNRSPRIDSALNYTGVALGNPYCASLCSLWVKEAGEELGETPEFKKSARALGVWEKNPRLRISVSTLRADPVSIAAMLPMFFILDHGGGKGHIYLGVGFDETTRKIQSIDPNSNPKGSREGGGVYALNIRSLDDEQLIGAIRIT
jgi:hypothetical protein